MSVSKKVKTISSVVGIGITLLLMAFVGSRLVPIIRGAEVRMDLPKDSEVSEPLVALNGIAKDTKKLLVNGSHVSLSPDGTFSWNVLLHPGYNTITVDTTDSRNHTKSHTYAFLLKELPTGTFALSALPSQN